MKPPLPACKKMPSTDLENSQRGQILPLGLALIFCALMGLLLFINLGRVVVVRERHRMQVDLTAEAGAVDMARCLNLAAALNKAQLALFMLLVYPPATAAAWASQVYSSRLIDIGVKVAAVVPEVGVFYVGLQNGLKPIPLWSVGSDGQPSPLPSLNLQRRYASDLASGLADMGQSGQSGDSSDAKPESDPTVTDQDRYSYDQKSDGQKIDVDASQVQRVIFRENGKLRSELREQDPINGKVKFIKDSGTQDLYPLDLVETGPHRVTVLGYASNEELFDSRFFPRPPPQWVIASAEAGGGDVRFLAFDPNADFDAYLISVERGLQLGSEMEEAMDIAHWLQQLGIQVPADLGGWTLIAH